MPKITDWIDKTFDPNQYVKINGLYMMVDSSDTNILPTLKTGVWEKETTKILHDNLKGGDTFVDCGAHWGYYSLLASRIVGERGKVYSFEPNKVSYEILSHNIAVNDCSNVRAFSFGLWEFNATLEFGAEIGTTGGSHVLGIYRGSRRIPIYKGNMIEYYITTYPIIATTLDELFDPSEVQFLKLDCENSDGKILIGALKLLSQGNPQIISEHPNEDVLCKLGYVKKQDVKEEQTSFWRKNK